MTKEQIWGITPFHGTAVIVQPVIKSYVDRLHERRNTVEYLKKRGYKVVKDPLQNNKNAALWPLVNVPLKNLITILSVVAKCELVFFMKGWERCRRCSFVYKACRDYLIYYEEEL